MQKVLIMTDSYLGCADLAYFLSNELGETYEQWYEKFLENENEIRTDIKIQELLASKNFTINTIKNDEDLQPIGYNDEEVHFKIVEIPEGIEWHSCQYECAVGEYICENHKTWS